MKQSLKKSITMLFFLVLTSGVLLSQTSRLNLITENFEAGFPYGWQITDEGGTIGSGDLDSFGIYVSSLWISTL